MKRSIAALCAVLLLLGVFPFAAFANFNGLEEATKGLASDIYYMISLDDETELFSKNETTPRA